MKLRDIRKQLNELAPESYQESWDNSGLQLGDPDSEIARVCVALDLDDAVVEEAIRKDAQLVVTHHPLVFSPVKQVTTEDFVGRRLWRLARAGISYYAMHTNFDVAKMAELAAKRLQLTDVQVLDVSFMSDGQEYGIGCVGRLPQTCSVRSLAETVKEAFELEHVKMFGDGETAVEQVAICPGSGKSTIPAALQKGAGVLLTGDIDHHSGIDAVAQGLGIIDAGHYGLEHIFVPYLIQYMGEYMPSLEAFACDTGEVFEIV